MAKADEIKQRLFGPKVHRDAFLYLDPPKNDDDTFAQCESCVLWNGDKAKTCMIHGPKAPVYADSSCGLYIRGEQAESTVPGRVTPKESGLVHRKVRCEHCRFFDDKRSVCRLFETLNKSNPEIFDLDERVNEYGCCNANTPGKEEE